MKLASEQVLRQILMKFFLTNYRQQSLEIGRVLNPPELLTVRRMGPLGNLYKVDIVDVDYRPIPPFSGRGHVAVDENGVWFDVSVHADKCDVVEKLELLWRTGIRTEPDVVDDIRYGEFNSRSIVGCT